MDVLFALPIVLLFIILVVLYLLSTSKLSIYRVPSKNIDSVLFGELWIIRKAYWPDDKIEKFAAKIKKEKCTFVLFRDTTDGSLRGFYTETLVEGEMINGRKYSALYLGTLFFYTYYRGTVTIALAMLYSFARHWWITQPGVQAYMVFCALSYKAYLTAARTYPNLYPTYKNDDSKKRDTYKNVIDQVLTHLYPDNWNKAEFNIKVPGSTFDIPLITDDMLSDPDISFFFRQNKDYIEGIAMPCIASVSFMSIFQTIATVFIRLIPRTRPRKGQPKAVKRDRVPVVRRDLASSQDLDDAETHLSRVFDLGKKRQDLKKKKTRAVINGFRKSDSSEDKDAEKLENVEKEPKTSNDLFEAPNAPTEVVQQ